MNLLFTFLLFFSVSAYSAWDDYLNPRELGFPKIQELELPWIASGLASNELAPDPASLEVISFNCPSPYLWAAHPFQTTKDYIYAVTASYRDKKLPSANVVVISDFFQDECGRLVKAYWIVAFLSNEETMNTLVSKGRVIMKKPSGHPGEYVPGSTYASNVGDFLFLTAPTHEDLWKVEISQKNALSEGYQLNRYQWIR